MAEQFIADDKLFGQVVVHYARATSLGKLASLHLRVREALPQGRRGA